MPAQTQTTTIAEVHTLTPEVRELVLSPPDRPVPFEPGQWISLHLPVGERPPLVRAYSLSRPPESAGSLTLCFDRVPEGLGSGYLFERQVGDELTIAGALGNFKLPDPWESDLLFVARYTGIVPFRCMLLALRERPFRQRVHLIFGAHRAEDLIYHAEFLELAAREPRFSYFPTLFEPANAWSGAVGSELDLLARLAPGRVDYVPMVCGLKEFTRPVRDFFQSIGFERRAVRVEHYD
jgi:CDP-4-dehydro-6-deoxyglucose reductase, E3